MILLLSSQLLAVRALCPAPFSLEAGKCVFVNTSRSFSWCSANRQCAAIGGELVNSHSSLQLLGSMPSLNCSCYIWLGVSDLASERATSRAGWQLINGKGVLPLDNSLWYIADPNNSNGNQDCVAQLNHTYGKIADFQCSQLAGFACEFSEVAPPQPAITAWQRTPFKRSSYNPSTEYCYTDVLQVKNEMHCAGAAMLAGNNRQALYNSELRTCRLLQFTDAQVEAAIETSADWVKFSVL